jgi:hypothetical protein
MTKSKEAKRDQQFREYIQRQPSCLSGHFSEHINGEGRSIAAHVRRASNSGTSAKPLFSCVPLTQSEHDLQHRQGEAACLNFCKPKDMPWTSFDAKEWFNLTAQQYLQQWVRSQ